MILISNIDTILFNWIPAIFYNYLDIGLIYWKAYFSMYKS